MMDTKRRGFIGTALGSVAVAGAAFGFEGKNGTTEVPPLPFSSAKEWGGLVTSPPVVMAPRTDGMEIGWAVTRLSRGWIEFENGRDTRVVVQNGWGFVPQGDRVLRVRLDGLEPGTAYRYRTVTEALAGASERVESGWREFRTLDANAASTRFVVWNDTHAFADSLNSLDKVTPEADFLIWNGDACNSTFSSEDRIVPQLYNPGNTDFTAARPLAFCWGNHDVRGTYGFKVSDYMATSDGKPYYAFRSGPVAVVVLNTGEDKADDHPSFKGQIAFDPLRREQGAWLEREVLGRPELRDAPYRVVFCHIPLRWTTEKNTVSADTFSERSRQYWHDALVKWGAQVVISGHTHRPRAIPANADFPYAQLTGGGPQLDIATWIGGEADSRSLRLKVNHWVKERAPLEMAFAPIAKV